MIVKEDQRFPFSQFDLCYTVKATNPNFKEKQTCNNFSLIFRTVFHWYSFTQLSNLFFGNKSNSDYKWSTKYLSGLVGKQINKQFTKQNIYRYQSLTGLLTAIRGFKHLLSSLFASIFASRAVSSTDNKFQQSNNLNCFLGCIHDPQSKYSALI